jgi:hypothetical protein
MFFMRPHALPTPSTVPLQTDELVELMRLVNCPGKLMLFKTYGSAFCRTDAFGELSW